MSYSIVVPKSVQKQLDRLPEQVYQRILKKIRILAEDPRPSGSLKLKGVDAEYRIRIGDYRLRYKAEVATAYAEYHAGEFVTLKSAEKSFRQGWHEAMTGQTIPLAELWDGIDVK